MNNTGSSKQVAQLSHIPSAHQRVNTLIHLDSTDSFSKSLVRVWVCKRVCWQCLYYSTSMGVRGVLLHRRLCWGGLCCSVTQAQSRYRSTFNDRKSVNKLVNYLFNLANVHWSSGWNSERPGDHPSTFRTLFQASISTSLNHALVPLRKTRIYLCTGFL